MSVRWLKQYDCPKLGAEGSNKLQDFVTSTVPVPNCLDLLKAQHTTAVFSTLITTYLLPFIFKSCPPQEVLVANVDATEFVCQDEEPQPYLFTCSLFIEFYSV